MALIGKIRDNGWLLIVLLALALGGFILMDMMSNMSRNSAADINTIGKVNGVVINRQEFARYEEIIYGGGNNDPYQRQSTVWNYFVEKALVEKEAAALGLGVGREELRDQQFGANPNQIITQRQFTPEMLTQIQQMVDNNQFPPDGRLKMYWAEQEREIIKDRLQQKIIQLVAKGIYAPKWQAEMAFRENNVRTDFLYVRVPFDKVAEGEFSVTDSDYAAYLKENAALYYNPEETRVIDYVAIEVIPTTADSAESRDALAKLVEEFRATTNDSAYVASKLGTLNTSFTKKSDLPPAVANEIMSAPIGTVIGPYIDGNSYVISKVMERKTLPDSVKARHILVKDPGEAGKAKVDSLKQVIETGKNTFPVLAGMFGTDGTKDKGGDLGFFAPGAMVPEFDNLCFNKAEQGKLYTVKTQFGWHLVEVTAKKFIKNELSARLANITQRIEPSKSTQQIARDKAIQLTSSAKTTAELESKAKELGLTLQTSAPFKASDYYLGTLGQGNAAVNVIRSAFKSGKIGMVTKDFFVFGDPDGGFFDSKYVVTALKSINPKGDATVESVKSHIDVQVKNRARAKVIMSKVAAGADLNAVANQFGVSIDTATQVTLMQSALPGVGSEPRVVGTAFRLKNGETAAPIDGNSGVYWIKAIADQPNAQLPPDLTLFRRQAASGAIANIRGRLFQIMRKNADLEDYRNAF